MQEREMAPRYYRDRLARFWWLLLLCGVCAGLGGWIGGGLFFTVYSSTAVVQVDMRMSSPTTSTAVTIDRLTRTCAQLVGTKGILTSVATREGMSVARMQSEVSAISVANTQLCSITVRDASPTRAARLANAIASAVIEAQTQALAQANVKSQQQYMDNLKTLSDSITTLKAQLAAQGQPPADPVKAGTLNTQLLAAQGQYAAMQGILVRVQVAEATGTPTLRIASPAQPNATPVNSHRITISLAGAFFGLMLGVFLVVGGDWVNTGIRTPQTVVTSFGWPQLGEGRATVETHTSTSAGNEGAALAGRLAHDIDFLSVDRPLRALALVSANPTLRTSELVAHLAREVAQKGRSTLLVDARLEDGAQSGICGVPLDPGLSDLILQFKSTRPTAQALMAYLRSPTQNGDPRLRLLASGSRPPNTARTLRSDPGRTALAAIVNLPAEIVLLDASPALFAGDGEALKAVFDGAIVLVDPATARRGDLAALGRAIAMSTVPMLGFAYIDGGRAGTRSDSAGPLPHGALEASLAKP
jgi:tyrosine-protein kinase